MEMIDQFGLYFNMLKIRYQDLNNTLTDNKVEIPNNKVNVFVNIETALNYISTVSNLENKLLIDKKYPEDMKTDIINIAGHYKDFFISNNLDTKVFLYMTDLDSDIDEFKENKAMEDYRSYYMLKYTSNPKFVSLGDKLRSEIIPDVKLICEYIPNVYFISMKNIDGGLIPYIIGESMPDRTNIIVSGDLHDTQYTYEENYLCTYYKRSVKRGRIICANTKDYLKEITRSENINQAITDLYNNGSFYTLLLSAIGDKYRSIPTINGLGLSALTKFIAGAIQSRKITKDIHNAMNLSGIFPDDIKGEIFTNFIVTDIKSKYEMLLDGDKKRVLSQIIDQSDLNTLHQLNKTRFQKNPLILESLLK